MTTYEYLHNFTKGKEQLYTNEELVENYRVSKQDIYIAMLYCKNYSGIKNLKTKYSNSIDDQKLDELSLKALLNAIKAYKSDTAKFNTLLYRCVCLEFSHEYIVVNRHKRIPRKMICNLEEHWGAIEDETDKYIEIELLIDLENNLTEDELKICKCIFEKDKFNKYAISQELHMSRERVCRLVRDIKKKLIEMGYAPVEV